jgi:(p)ppGpp synthase/HD superfamily hydrolase
LRKMTAAHERSSDGTFQSFDDALVYAAELHREHTRKEGGIPYIAHLLSVSGRVLSAGGTEVQAIGGLLHDAAEDHGGEATLEVIRKRFGPAVALIVADCTDSWVEPKPEWRTRKEAHPPHYRPSRRLRFWSRSLTRSTMQKRSSTTIVRSATTFGNVSGEVVRAQSGITSR